MELSATTLRLRLVFALTFAFCAAGISVAQPSDSEQRVAIEPRMRTAHALEGVHNATFRLDVKLVQIPVIVTDMRDRPVMDLDKSVFRVFEDDVEQEISTLSMADGAVSTGVVFDASGSMRSHIAQTREAVKQFMLSTIPGDEFFLVRFSDNPKLITPLTRFPDGILKELSGIRPHGWTALNDAVFRSFGEIKRATNPRRVLLVLTDGVDNNSRYSDAELLSLAREADVAIFAIGLFERPRFLERLGDETGGRVIWVRKLNDLPEAMEKLSEEIRNQYVIGYFSNRPQRDGKYHKIRVEVQAPASIGQVRVTWRKGYMAP
jgi:Ca-activated chloride channel family protein